MRRLAPILCLLTALAPLAAHADEVTTFDLSGSYWTEYQSRSTPKQHLSGSIVIDTTSGQVLDVDFPDPFRASSVTNFGQVTSDANFGPQEPNGPHGPFGNWTTWAVFPGGKGLDGTTYGLEVYQWYAYDYDGQAMRGQGIEFDPSLTSLVGYQGGTLGAAWVNLHLSGGTSYDAELTPISTVDTAATPEPSSFFLLGTGLLGAVGEAKRRLLA